MAACGISLVMTRARPSVRDDFMGGGQPIVVSRQAHDHESPPMEIPVVHSYAALAYYTGGRARMAQQGEWKLREGDVLLVPAGEPHHSLERRRPEYWGLGFCVACVVADGGAALLAPFERVRDGASPVVRIPLARREYLERLFQELERVTRDPVTQAAASGPVQRSLLTLILAEVDRAFVAAPVGSGKGGSVVIDALRFIERNCLRSVTLGEIAAAVGRSPAYVTSSLTQATGRSAGQWVVSGRMAEARRRLLHSDEMVDVISERVGYADATHFIRMFRREHGATPAAWRAAQTRVPSSCRH
jgi:AraC family transcriptional regulator, transcriptional activator of pobA